jgi:hypothetical protein
MLGLLRSSGFFELLEMLPAHNILLPIRIYFGAKAGVLSACLPDLDEVIGRPRDLGLEACPYYTFKRAGHRG